MSSILIPQISDPDINSWADIHRSLAAGLHQSLHQPWQDRPDPSFAPCETRLGHRGTTLFIHAVLSDREPCNRARTPNERTWELGDAFELFLKTDVHDSDLYYEFHVTPENQRLQLRFPNREVIGRVRQGGEPLSPWLVAPSLFSSRARISPDRDQWEVFMRLDLVELFGPVARPTGALRLLISRYDYQPGNPDPVLSCNQSALLPEPDFHQQAHWTPAKLA